MPVLKNAKHEAVAQAFVADPAKIGWRAYKSVYRKSSKHAAETSFGDLLKKAEFKARVDELMGAAASDVVMSAREVLEELSHLGRGNIQDSAHLTVCDDLVGEVNELPRHHAAAIGELTVETYMDGRGDDAREVKRVKLKLHDKRAALNDLGRHHKLFGGALDVGDIIVEIRKFTDDRGSRSKSKTTRRAA